MTTDGAQVVVEGSAATAGPESVVGAAGAMWAGPGFFDLLASRSCTAAPWTNAIGRTRDLWR